MTPTQEEWRPVPGYEGAYEVSDHGRVRSLDRVVQRASRPMKRRGQILRARPMDSGHVQVQLGRTQNRLVHHLVLLAFVGPRPEGMEGCHNDGNPANNSAGNLRWDTRSANCYDRVQHGRDHKRNRTACPRGHRLAAPNLVLSTATHGHRGCLACSRARANGQTARKLGRPFDLQAAADAHYDAIMGSEAAT